MVKKSQIQVRISADDKEKAIEVFDQYGLDMSAAVRLFIRRTIRENRLPFNFEDREDPRLRNS